MFFFPNRAKSKLSKEHHLIRDTSYHPYAACHNWTRKVKLRDLPRGVDSSCLDGWPGGWNPTEVPNPAAGKIVYTSRFSTRNPNSFNNHTYNFHVSELLNLSFGWPGGCQKKVIIFGHPPGIIMTCRVTISNTKRTLLRNTCSVAV